MTGMIILIMTAASLVSGCICGRMPQVTEAALNEPVNAVELAVYLCGGMCFWCVLMSAAESSGITGAAAAALKVPLSLIFRDIDKNGRAFSAICMNITANLLGLGNAATPLGIEAIHALAEEEKCGETAGDSMIKFTVINTASLTLIPSTAASLRSKYGSAAPMEIMIPVILTSAAALTAALAAAEAGCIIRKAGEGRKRIYDRLHHSRDSGDDICGRDHKKDRCVR